MVITAAVRHHDGGGAEGDGESAGVRQTPLDSTGLRWTANQAESGGLVNWTGLHQTPPDYSLAVLSDSAMDLAGHSVWWSLVESNRIMWGRDKDSPLVWVGEGTKGVEGDVVVEC